MKKDLIYPLIFLYFLTLHADQLNCVIGDYTIRINNLLAFGLIFSVLIRLRSTLISIPKSLLIPLAAIACSLLLSLAFSPYKIRCTFFVGWYALTITCYVLLPYLLMRLCDPQKVLSLYSASFIVVGLYAALQLALSLFGINDPFTTQFISDTVCRPNAFCYEPSFYALYMTPFVFLINARFLVQKASSTLSVVGINALYLISTSTGAFFAYLIFFPLALLIPGGNRKRTLKFIILFAAVFAFLALVFPFITKKFFMKFFFSGFMTHHSFYERWVGIENAYQVFIQNPLLGIGLGAYPQYLMDAFLQGNGTFTFITHSLEDFTHLIKAFEPSSVLIEILASLGSIGIIAFIGLLASLFFQARKAYRFASQEVFVWMVGLTVTLIVLQFNQGLFRTYIWVQVALTFSYLEMLGQTSMHRLQLPERLVTPA